MCGSGSATLKCHTLGIYLNNKSGSSGTFVSDEPQDGSSTVD